MRHRAVALLAVTIAALACRTSEQSSGELAAGALALDQRTRATVREIGRDTLSAAARILRIVPEPDGEALILFFADPARMVTSGLAIQDERTGETQLLWPDSVTSAWWPSPHTLAFTTTTGAGARLVVDVHAEELQVLDRAATAAAVTPERPPGSAPIARATRYIDSTRMQPSGMPQNSSLRYLVTELRTAPGGRHGAFHAIARDSAGRRLNPGWYFLEYASGHVVPLDEIVGSAEEMPEDAGAWSQDGTFFYARGLEIRQVEVRDGAK